MAEGTVAAITVDHAGGALLGRDLGDQLDGPVLVHVSLCVDEARVAIVVLLEDLRATGIYSESLLRNHAMSAKLTCPVCVTLVTSVRSGLELLSDELLAPKDNGAELCRRASSDN